MNIFNKPPINRHGVSTEDRLLPKIPVNTAYELEPEVCDELSINGGQDPYAPFPYQLSIFDNHIDIYSGDGRIVATVMRDNFTSFKEFLFTARLMAYSYCFYATAAFAMRDLGIMHNGGTAVDKYKYEEKAKEFFPLCNALTYGGIWGGEEMYEPVRYAAKGNENETEMEFSELPRVPRSDFHSEIEALDARLPEMDEEIYNNGYA